MRFLDLALTSTFGDFFRKMFIDAHTISDHELQVEEMDILLVLALVIVAELIHLYRLTIKGGLVKNPNHNVLMHLTIV